MLKIVHTLKSLLKARDGSMFVMVGLSAAALVGVGGLAIDAGRASLAQAKLSSALDAAGLAAGSTVSTTNLNTEVSKYMTVNYGNYLGSNITNLNAAASTDNSVITLSATASMPTLFMRIFGKNDMSFSASSEITRASSGLELVMVLDNTGSMSGTKLTSLKTSATDLVNILFGSSATPPSNLWVGLVPFSQAVNVGTQHSTWLDNTYTNSLDWGPTSWGGCVDARDSGGDITDTVPSTQKFKAYYWGDDGNNNWISYNKGKKSYSSPLSTSKGPNKDCPKAVTGMTSNKNTVLTAINAMTAQGNTHINLGAVWGWRMLSPNWRGLWGGEMDTNNLPLNYNTPKMNKAAIIMTDGDNVISNSSHGAYWYLSDGKLGTTTQSTAEAQLDSRLSQVCTAMKNNNIVVYTVSYGSISTSSQNMLRNCATQSGFYFNSPTSADLQAAFQSIGDSLSNLRISK